METSIGKRHWLSLARLLVLSEKKALTSHLGKKCLFSPRVPHALEEEGGGGGGEGEQVEKILVGC